MSHVHHFPTFPRNLLRLRVQLASHAPTARTFFYLPTRKESAGLFYKNTAQGMYRPRLLYLCVSAPFFIKKKKRDGVFAFPSQSNFERDTFIFFDLCTCM